MSKLLYLLRHAKALPEDGALGDRGRPLNEVGLKASADMAAYAVRHAIAPERVLCSPATRTRMTLEAFSALWKPVPVIQYVEPLYLASTGELLAELQALPDSVRSVMLVGHNPGLQLLALLLCGGKDSAALDALSFSYPTGGLATLRLDINGWAAIAPDCARLTGWMSPKRLHLERD